jgi:hypothetical protein
MKANKLFNIMATDKRNKEVVVNSYEDEQDATMALEKIKLNNKYHPSFLADKNHYIAIYYDIN